MRNLVSALTAVLTNAADLQSAIGKSYSTIPEEVWSMPDDVVYPRLAVAFYEEAGARIIPDLNTPDIEMILMKCWFVTKDSRLEATIFRDALRAKLHLQQQQLQRANVPVTFIQMRGTRIGKEPDTDKYQAYCEFKIVA